MRPSEVERPATDAESNDALRVGAPAPAASGGDRLTAGKTKDHTNVWANALGKELTDDELEGVVGGLLPS